MDYSFSSGRKRPRYRNLPDRCCSPQLLSKPQQETSFAAAISPSSAKAAQKKTMVPSFVFGVAPTPSRNSRSKRERSRSRSITRTSPLKWVKRGNRSQQSEQQQPLSSRCDSPATVTSSKMSGVHGSPSTVTSINDFQASQPTLGDEVSHDVESSGPDRWTDLVHSFRKHGMNGNVTKLEGIVEREDTFDLTLSCNQANEGRFVSLEPEKHVDQCTRLTPLTFDDAEVTNHFRSTNSGGEKRFPDSPSKEIDDFSLFKVLSPSPNKGIHDSPLKRVISPRSPCSPDNMPPASEAASHLLQKEDANSSSAFATYSPARVSPLKDSGEYCVLGEFSPASPGNLSIQSLDDFIKSPTKDRWKDLVESVRSEREPTSRVKLSIPEVPSLSESLGASAKYSFAAGEKKLKKLTPVNLWEDGDDIKAMPEDLVVMQALNLLPELCLSADNAHEQEDCQVMPSIDLTDLADADEGISMEGPTKNEDCGKEAADSVLAWSTLGMLLGSPAPRSVSTKIRKCPPMNLWDDGNAAEDDLDGLLSSDSDEVENGQLDYSPPSETNIDNEEDDSIPRINSSHSIPSICSENAQVYMRNLADEDVQGDPPQKATLNTDDAVDSALLWGALGMIFGSPAPKSVLGEKKLKTRRPVNLWEDGDDNEAMPADLVEMQALNLNEDASDTCSIPSMLPEEALLEEDEDHIPNLDDSNNVALPSLPKSNKDVADSTLAWTAFAAMLGSPAPPSVFRKSSTEQHLNLWEDGEGTDLLPELCLSADNEDEQDDCLDMPSIDLTELVDATEGINMEGPTKPEGCDKEAADSALAWSALGMLLGSPAPRSVYTKSRKCSNKNLWDDGNATDDDLDGLLSAHASLSPTNVEEEEKSIPLAGTSDEEDPTLTIQPRQLFSSGT